MRVLISAFGCSPYRGSECAIGWNLAKELAKYNEITVLYGDLSKEKGKEEDVKRFFTENAPIPNLRLVYVPPSKAITFIERLHRVPGMWGIYYLAYNLWHRKAYKVAQKLHREHPFDVVHKLNMLGFREPGYLWKIGAPFVWGPVGGASNESIKFHRFFSKSGCIKVLARTILNEIQKRILIRPRRAAHRATKIWAITSDDIYMVSKIWGCKCEQMLDGGTDSALNGSLKVYSPKEKLRLIWSGIHTSRKALPILLEALATPAMKGNLEKIHLDVLGAGPETKGWEALAQKLGVDSCIEWHGMLKRDAGLDVMREGHAFVCTSIKEASSIVVMEALSLGLPVICHDACGMGVEVTETSGVKIPLRDPETSIAGFAEALQRFIKNPELVETLSHGALARAQELTWSAKAATLTRGYEEAVKSTQNDLSTNNTNKDAYEN